MPQPASCFLRECRDSVWLLGRAFFAPSPSAPICPALAFLLAQGLFCGADGGRFVFEGNDPAVAVVDCWARRILAPLRRAPIAPRSSPPLARGFFVGRPMTAPSLLAESIPAAAARIIGRPPGNLATRE